MGDLVQSRLEETVPALIDLQAKGVFTSEEIREIVRRRRGFEFDALGSGATPGTFLRYIQYEIALETLRQHRCAEGDWRPIAVHASSGVPHIMRLFQRATRRWPGDVKLWRQGVEFALSSGFVRLGMRFLMQALSRHPRERSLWLMSAREEIRSGHVELSRRILQLALRHIPKDVELWRQYFDFEAHCVVNKARGKNKEKIPGKAGHPSLEAEMASDADASANEDAKDNGGAATVDTALENLESAAPRNTFFGGTQKVFGQNEGLGQQKMITIHEQKAVEVRHLLLLVKAAISRLDPKEASEFLSAALESFSHVLNYGGEAVGGIEVMGKQIAKELMELRKTHPSVTFILWKLRVLSMVKRGQFLNIKQQLTRLVMELDEHEALLETTADAANNAHDGSNIRKRRRREAPIECTTHKPCDTYEKPRLDKPVFYETRVCHLALVLFLLSNLAGVNHETRVVNGPAVTVAVAVTATDSPPSPPPPPSAQLLLSAFPRPEVLLDREFVSLLRENRRLLSAALIVPDRGGSSGKAGSLAHELVAVSPTRDVVISSTPNADISPALSDDASPKGSSLEEQRRLVWNGLSWLDGPEEFSIEVVGEPDRDAGKKAAVCEWLLETFLALPRFMETCAPIVPLVLRLIKELLPGRSAARPFLRGLKKILDAEVAHVTLCNRHRLILALVLQHLAMEEEREEAPTVNSEETLTAKARSPRQISRSSPQRSPGRSDPHTSGVCYTSSVPYTSKVLACLRSAVKQRERLDSELLQCVVGCCLGPSPGINRDHRSALQNQRVDSGGNFSKEATPSNMREVIDLLYAVCPSSQVMGLVRALADRLCYISAQEQNTTCGSNIANIIPLTSLLLLEFSRVMEPSFGSHLLPVERESVRRALALCLIRKTLQWLVESGELLESQKGELDVVSRNILEWFRVTVEGASKFDSSEAGKRIGQPLSISTFTLALGYASAAALFEGLAHGGLHSPGAVVQSLRLFPTLGARAVRLASLRVLKIRESFAFETQRATTLRQGLQAVLEDLTITRLDS